MSAIASRALAPILKIRAALRERKRRPAAAAPNVVSITDSLMLGWAEQEVEIRGKFRTHLAAVETELSDLRQLATAIVNGEREVAPLEKLLVFTKLESAAGLVRQAFNVAALCCLALVLWLTFTPADDHDDMTRAPRGARVVRTIKRAGGGAGIRKEESAA